jgi:hypothetical protein
MVLQIREVLHRLVTVYSGIRSGYPVSGHRLGRVGILVHRFPLPHKEHLPAQFSSPQNDYVFRLRIR